MEHKLFQQRLLELAEVSVIKEPRKTGERFNEQDPEVMRNGEVFEIDRKDNSTWPVRVKRIKYQPRPCPDCDKTVLERVVNVRLCGYPIMHWRRGCSACGLHQCPESGEYKLTSTQVNSAWVKKLRDK